MEWLKNDLKRYTPKGRVLLAFLFVITIVLVARAGITVSEGGSHKALVWLLLALIVAKTSAQHPLGFFKNGSGASFPDALIFLAVVMLGPYHGVLLGVVDMFLSSWRLKLKPTNYILNLSNIYISVYVSGMVYYAVAVEMQSLEAGMISGQTALTIAAPLVAMVLIYYGLQFAILA